jgi:hypothetical protein
MPSTKMTGVIVREWLSHNDNDPVHRITVLSNCGKSPVCKYAENRPLQVGHFLL